MKNLFPTFSFLAAIFFSFLTFQFHSKTSVLAMKPAVEPTSEMRIANLYRTIQSKNESVPKLESFSQGLAGFYDLRAQGLIVKDILTIVDFSLSSTVKRLWVIDLSTNTVLLNSLVSHGINSGTEFADHFSNALNSNKSSLGFFATGKSYIGKNGLSLKLDGLEKNTNDMARARAVVLHGAVYANPSILQTQSFLGRSQGCPAVPQKVTRKLIDLIKNKSCLFIYHPSRDAQTLTRLMSQSTI